MALKAFEAANAAFVNEDYATAVSGWRWWLGFWSKRPVNMMGGWLWCLCARASDSVVRCVGAWRHCLVKMKKWQVTHFDAAVEADPERVDYRLHRAAALAKMAR